MKIKIFRALSLLFVAGLLSFSFFRQWTIKEGYNIAIDNFDITGKFEKFDGSIVFDESSLERSSFKVKVDVKSLSTGNILKTKSALSAEWFHASQYPSIDFVSSKIEKAGSTYIVKGDLTIRGITRPVVIPFAFVNEGSEGVFSGEFVVNRVDFEVGSEQSEVEYDVKVILKVPVKR
ncbi:MAG: hypothetical protein ABS46_20850 [Cytophagaceae bacterium SCN 52-12]|nr:MAG: hypothetical protein ABS46_20850 [Cytophagaceae bacterium SCN 52-12]